MRQNCGNTHSLRQLQFIPRQVKDLSPSLMHMEVGQEHEAWASREFKMAPSSLPLQNIVCLTFQQTPAEPGLLTSGWLACWLGCSKTGRCWSPKKGALYTEGGGLGTAQGQSLVRPKQSPGFHPKHHEERKEKACYKEGRHTTRCRWISGPG